ncbi:hypothetical protein BKA93DRAFT_561811 [Sparassis latifolia]
MWGDRDPYACGVLAATSRSAPSAISPAVQYLSDPHTGARSQVLVGERVTYVHIFLSLNGHLAVVRWSSSFWQLRRERHGVSRRDMHAALAARSGSPTRSWKTRLPPSARSSPRSRPSRLPPLFPARFPTRFSVSLAKQGHPPARRDAQVRPEGLTAGESILQNKKEQCRAKIPGLRRIHACGQGQSLKATSTRPPAVEPRPRGNNGGCRRVRAICAPIESFSRESILALHALHGACSFHGRLARRACGLCPCSVLGRVARRFRWCDFESPRVPAHVETVVGPHHPRTPF